MSRKLRRKHQNRPSFLVQLPLIYVDPPADLEAVADWLHEYRWVVGTFGNLQAMTLSGMAYKPMPADWKQQLFEAFPSVRVAFRSNQ